MDQNQHADNLNLIQLNPFKKKESENKTDNCFQWCGLSGMYSNESPSSCD